MKNFTFEYVEMWKRWNDFDGKSDVREYWMAILVGFIVSVILSILDSFIGINLLGGLYWLAAIIPGWALLIRRFHDTGRSGWYWLWALIPLIGWIIVLIALIKDSE